MTHTHTHMHTHMHAFGIYPLVLLNFEINLIVYKSIIEY